MDMDNPLLNGKSELELSPWDEQQQKFELLDQNQTSLLDLQRRKLDIEETRKDLDLDRKEKNLEALKSLNDSFKEISEIIVDPTLVRRVANMTETGRDLKAMSEYALNMNKLRKDLAESAFEESATTGKKKRIEFAFQSQGVQMAVRMETDG